MTQLKPEGYRIYNYMRGRYEDEEALPFDVDFKTDLDITLYKVPAPLNNGEPTEIIYYSDYTMTVPVCKLEYEFLRFHKDNFGEAQLHGFIKQLILKLKWYKNNGELSEEYKDLGMIYNPSIHLEKMMEEGVLKRSLIYRDLKSKVMGMLQMAFAGQMSADEAKQIGVTFVEENHTSFDNYIDTYNKNIIEDIQNNTSDAWLDIVIDSPSGLTIRNYITGALDLG